MMLDASQFEYALCDTLLPKVWQYRVVHCYRPRIYVVYFDLNCVKTLKAFCSSVAIKTAVIYQRCSDVIITKLCDRAFNQSRAFVLPKIVSTSNSNRNRIAVDSKLTRSGNHRIRQIASRAGKNLGFKTIFRLFVFSIF